MMQLEVDRHYRLSSDEFGPFVLDFRVKVLQLAQYGPNGNPVAIIAIESGIVDWQRITNGRSLVALISARFDGDTVHAFRSWPLPVNIASLLGLPEHDCIEISEALELGRGALFEA